MAEKQKYYFGFALADSMFPEECQIRKFVLSPAEAADLIYGVRAELTQELIPCINPSHLPTIDVMKQKYGIDVPIPDTPPHIKLKQYDRLIVMGVRGLPRLTDRHEYTQKEIAEADFKFSVYCVS